MTPQQTASEPAELAGSRTFTWFTPGRRRPSEYELYTVGQQSTPEQWLDVDWPLRFDDGRAPWVEESSQVRTSAWATYRDPCQVWQRPYVSVSNQEGSRASRAGTDQGLRRGDHAALV